MAQVVGTAGIVTLIMPVASFAATPSGALGKSITVTWQENRQQKLPGEAVIQNRAATGELNIYVSEVGRTFSRMRFSMLNKRGNRSMTGKNDQVSGGGTARAITFRGNEMTAGLPRGSAGATLISVSFDSGFQSCTAQVRSGKSGGAAQTTTRSVINGNMV